MRVVSCLGLLGLLSANALADGGAPVDANQVSMDTTGTGLLTTGDGTILEPGLFHASAVFHHLARPVVRESNWSTEVEALVSRREQLDLSVSAGVWRYLQVSARIPLILSQPSTGLTGDSGSSAGWADPEIGLHGALLDGQIFPVQLGVSVPVSIPVGRSDSWMSHGGWTAEPRLVAATLNGPVRFAGRLGYRIQPGADLLHFQNGSTLRAAAGLSWIESETDEVGLELVADLDLASPDSEVLSRLERQRLELLAGYSHTLGGGFSVMAGLGTGLTSALPTPRWRGFLSVSWSRQAVEIDPCKHIPKGKPIPPECPDPIRDDLDQDGIFNDLDQCPVDPEDFDGLLDEDGCPEDDADSDGLLDPVDICPLEPETVDGVKDEDGCPDDQLVALTRTSIVQLQRVSFDFAKATLKSESEPVMWAVLGVLQKHPSLVLRVEGHTDNVGSDAFNAALSVARSQACREWLIKNSENPDDISQRVKVVGMGETRPTDTNRTSSGKAENRRVEFSVDSLDESAGIPIFRALQEVDRLPGAEVPTD